MGNTEYIGGYGHLSLAQAVNLAQNSEGGVDQRLAQHLEKKLGEVYARLQAQPNSYILPPDEFALINYYRSRFGDSEIIKSATKRFWDNHRRVFSTIFGFMYGANGMYIMGLSEMIPSNGRRNGVFGSRETGSDRFSSRSKMAYGRGQAGQQVADEYSATEVFGKRIFRPSAARLGPLPFISLFLILISYIPPTLAVLTSQQPDLLPVGPSLSSRAPNQSTPLLECLQVSPPILSSKKCQQTLMPFIGEYNPPECDFNRVTFSFAVTSAGRQFDRLGFMFFSDTEIFRTSTAEPTQNGIIWTYTKDMSSYLSLFKEPQKIIFDLGNLVDDTYTGLWNTTLTASFFTAEDLGAADVIIPVSARQSASDKPSIFRVPESKAVNSLALPQNIKKAVFTISSCGQATEEFWWANVLSSDTAVFGNETTLYGYSPFREVQLLIDGLLAGVAFPFPVIFTGGVTPGFWRPVVGIDAFDLLEDEIDISAFLPILCDGNEHTFEIRVVGINDDGKGHGTLTDQIGSNWVVTGKIFVWLDADGSITKGTVPTISAPEPALNLSSSIQRGANGSVVSLDYSVKAARSLSISSTIETAEGSRAVSWSQELSFWITGQLSNGGNDQSTSQSTTGKGISSHSYSKLYDYPLWVISSYRVLTGGNFTIDAKMGRGKYAQQLGELAFPSQADTFDYSRLPGYSAPPFQGTQTNNWQNGTASYLGAPALKKSFGSGSTEQLFSLDGITDPAASGVDLYRRHIVAANDSIVFDQEVFGSGGQGTQSSYASASRAGVQSYAKLGIRAILGRGPF
ncbi:peptide-N4-(N-acetyl-beta-glucosaminyl)asparagine amidase A [Lentithecium fluviatile CBS 122367]|uniref:Peptide-N4-(N-acetyl-beta-glucosaminyl)asparagine amidase A n=1 Tax=Lentithecium fluviatile CBS 122367 TaxID=1168545 RepID=A0A6G1JPC2_9PLEO|nr:peptide-N4-(N-acetyl-beta-glucosaminyl)asparagine amidase A [Lentithecium fluviatile CBS 122367]